jgi:hypothetical protein
MEANIQAVDEIGSKYDCPLYLPPFKDTNHPFFKVDELKKDSEDFKSFFVDSKKANIDFKFVEEFVEIIIGE